MILLVKDESAKRWFENAIGKMIEKRRDPESFMTGAKDLRTNLLSYLTQKGNVKTANIWCRGIIYSEIKEFLSSLEHELQKHDFEGVVELHLQDREINSPHIQYVGTNAEEAQTIIANFVLRHGYEESLESAIQHNYTPAYQSVESKYLRIDSTDREVEIQEIAAQREQHKQEIISNIKEFIGALDDLKSDFIDIMSLKEEATTRERVRENRTKSTADMLNEWEQKAKNRTRRR